jgi:PD-(D/E)XK nuclease superfamily
MALVRPRLNDYYGLPFTQEEADFAIPFLDDDIPLYVDPFLLWKSPSLQDQSLHTSLVSSFNHLGDLAKRGKESEATDALIRISECQEVGLGSAREKKGKRIGKQAAHKILALFREIPQIKEGGIQHVEEIQLFVDQIAKDRISDLTCSLLKSFLIDFTIDQCSKHNIPSQDVTIEVFDYKTKRFKSETVQLPRNPSSKSPLLLVPKRWLRFSPWINYDDYFANGYVSDSTKSTERVAILQFNRENYGMVVTYVRAKELTQADCKNDPLFKPIAVTSAKRKLDEIKKLPTGKSGCADKRYEDNVCQLLASLLYPQLDFAAEQSRTDSGVLIRDLIFYNNRSFDFLKDVYDLYQSRQIVMELKNVKEVEREHVNQLNRYLTDEFGRLGVLVTRKPLPKPIFKNTVDLWSGQRRCILTLTDADLETMVTVFETKQRLPIEVLKRTYVEFSRACPS